MNGIVMENPDRETLDRHLILLVALLLLTTILVFSWLIHILWFIFVCSWIVFSIYYSLRKSGTEFVGWWNDWKLWLTFIALLVLCVWFLSLGLIN